MDEPVVTAAPPPTRLKNLAQQETDFTSEGSPPPGSVGPVASLPAVDEASDHVHRKPILPVSVKEAALRDAARAARERTHDAKYPPQSDPAQGKAVIRQR